MSSVFGVAESLVAMSDSGTVARSQPREGIVAAVSALLGASATDGTLRADVRTDDVVSSLLGIFLASHSAEQAQRILDLPVDGLVATR